MLAFCFFSRPFTNCLNFQAVRPLQEALEALPKRTQHSVVEPL
jgi:hypothetical protein